MAFHHHPSRITMYGEGDIPVTALKPRKPSKRPATASARMDGNSIVPIQKHKSSTRTIPTPTIVASNTTTTISSTSGASTSLGNSQLIHHMKLMGIYSSTNNGSGTETGQNPISSLLLAEPSTSNNFLSTHRRSASFLEMVDRSSCVRNEAMYSIPNAFINGDQTHTTEDVAGFEGVTSTDDPEMNDRDSGGEVNAYLILSQALARIAELESSESMHLVSPILVSVFFFTSISPLLIALEYYERACVDATVDSDFWQKEYNRLYDVVRNAEEKEAHLLSQIRTLEARVKYGDHELFASPNRIQSDPQQHNQNKRPISTATVISPLVDPLKCDTNCHSMLEIASSSASVTTINESRAFRIATTIQKKQKINGLARVASSSTMKTNDLAAFNAGSSTSTLKQMKPIRVDPSFNPLIAPVLKEHFGASGPEMWNQEKRRLISKWVVKAQAEIEGEGKRNQTTPTKRLNVSPGIQAVTDALYNGWTIDSTDEPVGTMSNLQTILPINSAVQNLTVPPNNRHPFSISKSDPALRARCTGLEQDTINAEQASNQTQTFEGLQAHARWGTWRIQAGK